MDLVKNKNPNLSIASLVPWLSTKMNCPFPSLNKKKSVQKEPSIIYHEIYKVENQKHEIDVVFPLY